MNKDEDQSVSPSTHGICASSSRGAGTGDPGLSQIGGTGMKSALSLMVTSEHEYTHTYMDTSLTKEPLRMLSARTNKSRQGLWLKL